MPRLNHHDSTGAKGLDHYIGNPVKGCSFRQGRATFRQARPLVGPYYDRVAEIQGYGNPVGLNGHPQGLAVQARRVGVPDARRERVRLENFHCLEKALGKPLNLAIPPRGEHAVGNRVADV